MIEEIKLKRGYSSIKINKDGMAIDGFNSKFHFITVLSSKDLNFSFNYSDIVVFLKFKR